MQPFAIHTTQAHLADLQDRLARTRWPDTVDAAGWSTGTNLGYLQHLVTYWRTGYDWRAQEAHLNQLPQFRAMVDGVGIHFVYQRGIGPAPHPLILTHGWPGSFFELHKIIPLLADPAAYGGDPNDAFDVVVPSLPGFGFSDRPAVRGASRNIPALWCSLMTDVLGYTRFGAHGTDIGAFVTNRLGLEHDDRLSGIHVTLTAEPYRGPGSPALTAAELAWLAERERTHELEQAYAHVHRTTPQTLAYGLTDSPVGLAAWILEKWRAWSDCDGDVERRFTRDELLTTVMLYWLTETISSSIRVYDDWKLASAGVPHATDLYADVPPGADSAQLPPHRRISTPAAVAQFDSRPPREWVERAYADLRRLTVMPRGGHFAAMEEPELLVEDLRAFFRPLR